MLLISHSASEFASANVPPLCSAAGAAVRAAPIARSVWLQNIREAERVGVRVETSGTDHPRFIEGNPNDHRSAE
jgi:hypothetical protein